MLHRQSRLPARVTQLIFPPVYSTEMIVAHMRYVYTGTDTYELVGHSWPFEAVNASSRENGKGEFKKISQAGEMSRKVRALAEQS